MRARIFCALMLVGSRLASRADEQLPVLPVGSEVYSNVTITSISATDIFFTHAGGMANAKIKNLSPEWQQHFHFNPQKAKAVELKQAANLTNYHYQLVHAPAPQPAVAPPENLPAGGRVSEPMWRNDFPGAVQQARAENKLVLLDFTGSDWCPWCIKFDHDVLATENFAAYAGQKLELVKVDFPRHTLQSTELQTANRALAAQFGVDGYPTYVLVDAAGKELGRQVGYAEGGPEAFIRELNGFIHR